MNKAAIKNFAIEARKKLIASVKDKAGRIGITKDSITKPISKGEGYVIFPTHIGIEAKLTGKEVKQRENLVNRIKSKEDGYELVMEEVAYTWFNRLIAIRFMEVNDYLPSRVRVLSSETAGKYEPDIVTQALDVDLEFSQAEVDEILTLKEKNAMDQLFRMLFVKQCNELGKILPELFENTSKENNDYTEILLDISYTNEDGVLRDLLKIDESDFLEAVEIIGWMYQYYNTEPKDETFALLKKNVKITKERIPTATQLFTPDWIVRYMVENSLGRLWLEGHPDSDIKDNWKYYLDEAAQEEDVKAELDKLREERKNLRPEDIKVIDLCMGSGHILVYAFDVLMDIYKACGYTERDAAKLILQHNLYGLDIDERAYQLAYFAVMMKARAYSRRILNEGIRPHLCAIQESNGIPKQEVMDIFARLAEGPLWSDKLREDVEYLIDVFKDAKEYGSILEIRPVDFEAIEETIEVIGENKTVLNIFEAPYKDMILQKLPVLVEQGKLLSQKYDVAVTNPPYMGSSGMSAKLSEYVRKNYPDLKADLFACFIDKTIRMTQEDGYTSMITMHSWMFLSSFDKLREYIIKNHRINSIVHLGMEAFDDIIGKVVSTAAFVLNQRKINSYCMNAVRLVDFYDSRRYLKKTEYFNDHNRYVSCQDNFVQMPGTPVAYWVSNNIREVFQKGALLRELAAPKIGMRTGDNERFLRLWHEVRLDKIGLGHGSRESAKQSKNKWFPYNKGGDFRKWYGNNEYVVNWENDGEEIKENTRKVYPHLGDNLGWKISNEQYYFQPSITWSFISSYKFGVRYSPAGAIFDVGGSSVFVDMDKMRYFTALLCSNLVFEFLSILNPTLNFQVRNVASLPVCYPASAEVRNRIDMLAEANINITKSDWDSFETSWEFKEHPFIKKSSKISDCYSEWQQHTQNQFIKLKANEEELNRLFNGIYGLQDEITSEVEDRDITIRKADLHREIRSFISYAVGCMLGRYSLDVEGLIFAGGDWKFSQYAKFIPDEDNIVPLTDEEYFADDIVARFVEFVKVVYGQDTLEENLDFIAQALGNKGTTSREIIRSYFLKDFYADHIRIYQKRPIYWLFDSGKENSFKALIYMHRYDQDTVGRVRADYLHKAQAYIENAIAHCDVVMESTAPSSEKAKAVKHKEKLVKQLAETRLYDQAIAHIAHQRIAIDLDDGVVVNYAKFQGVEVANEGKKAVKIDLLAKIK